MKTAISLPNELFEALEQLAKRSKRSRSELYAIALREYVARHTPDQVTEALNAALADIDQNDEDSKFIRAAARRTLMRSEW